MQYVLGDLHHECAIPNTTLVYYWEADLLSITRAGLVHEFEIKLSYQDFKADAKKNKHWFIENKTKSPSYFWYVTYNFDVTPPEKAGWIKITKTENTFNFGWRVEVRKSAPRLHTQKLSETQKAQIIRSLAHRVFSAYYEKYIVNS